MKKIKYIVLFLLLMVIFPLNIKAESLKIYLFYGDGCPHCADEEKFFESYLENNKDIKLVKYEVWHSKDNQELFKKVQDKLNNHANGVPYLIIGKDVVVGYMEDVTNYQIEDTIKEYRSSKKKYDVIDELNKKNKTKETKINKIKKKTKKEEYFYLPVFGKVKSNEVSLPLLSVVLGFIDGFNPCAMWILLFLITMLINTKDRKKMWILGLTFIITSGLVYLMFMLTWLNLAMFISKAELIRILVALVSFIIGFINLKKYYESTKKEDGCDVVDKKNRKEIINRITNIMNEKSLIVAIIGIIILAASVNIIELMCSVSIPLLFTQILAMNNLNIGSYALYMFIYIFFFLIDDIVIFTIAMITHKVTGISTKYNKYSHLIAGIIILLIGLLLLINPSILMFNF
ncbi:MAG: hypothetical protein IIZ40_03535 [Bacilli bacterium]|nr:hypothetical protein [Bacilli bacterium]